LLPPRGTQNRAQSTLNRPQFVRTTNGRLPLWDVAFLRPTLQKRRPLNARSISRSGAQSGFARGSAQEKTRADAHHRSPVADAGRRSCKGTGRRGDDARRCRRQDVDDAQRRIASGERHSHASDADDHREICCRRGCLDRNPRAVEAVAHSTHLG